MVETGKDGKVNGLRHFLILFFLLLSPLGPPVRCGETAETKEKIEQGRRLFETGDLLHAATVFEDVLKSQPDQKLARSMLFTCYRFIGIEYYGLSRCDDALAVWRKALTLEPQSQEMERFIERCESETKAIGRINGDTVFVVEKSPPAVEDPPVRKVQTPVTPKKPSVSSPVKPVVPEKPPVLGAISFGLASGMAVGLGSSPAPKTGPSFAGNVSVFSRNYRLGVGLEGTYSRFYGEASDVSPSPRYLAVSGLSLSAIVGSNARSSFPLHYRVGLGIYELVLSSSADLSTAGADRKSTVLGLSFGLGWRKHFSGIAATVDAKYTHLPNSLSPDLLQISIGIASN